MRFLDLEFPAVPEPVLHDFLQSTYGFDGTLTQLPSERDRNYRVDGADGRQVVLRIANHLEPRDFIELEVAALDHIAAADPALPVPRVLRTRHGEAVPVLEWPVTGGKSRKTKPRRYQVHVLSWLPGEVIGETRLEEGRLFDVGALVARLGRALRGFFHPAAGARDLLWDNAKAPRLLAYLEHMADGDQRAFVGAVLARFRDETLPELKRLRAQVIHADVHPFNALIDGTGRLSGIIDFGDVLHGALVQDLANPIADFLAGEQDFEMAIRAIGAGFRSVTPLEEVELAVLPALIEVRAVLAPVINAVRTAHGAELPPYLVDFGLRGLDLARQLQALGPEHIVALVAGRTPRVSTRRGHTTNPGGADADVAALVRRRTAVMGSRLYVFYDPPLHLVRGEGVWLYDAAGRAYLDCYNNVPHVGHCHPRVVAAIAEQARKLNTNTRYITDEAIAYAERLTATTDNGLDAVLFVNSGSEANDVAWRMAKALTGNSGGLAMEFAYHGITDATDAFSPSNAPDLPLRDHIRLLPPPDDYRGPFKRGENDLASKYAALGGAVIDELAASRYGVAACMIDSAFMTNGMLDAPKGYVQEICARVRKAGGLFIADEVQSGFGRMGTAMWGHQHHGVIPDFITLGKPAGNGHPLGVVITRQELLDAFTRTAPFFSTFGGNNVSCAAGIAVLDVIRDEDLIANALTTGRLLRDGLRALMLKHDLIGDVRGVGLAIGVELVTDRRTLTPAADACKRLQSLIRDEGVLVGGEGRYGNILKVRPPIVLKPEHVPIVVGAVDRALARV